MYVYINIDTILCDFCMLFFISNIISKIFPHVIKKSSKMFYFQRLPNVSRNRANLLQDIRFNFSPIINYTVMTIPE